MGNFISPSFTPSPASGNLTGGADAGTTGATGYSVSIGYAPDGDVLSDSDTVNGNWSYGYDGFNRLASSCCSANSTANCPNGQSAEGYTYAYDRFGNRWQQNITGPSGSTGIASSASFSGGNNRVDQETYDAEGRITQVDGGSTATYVYNASGLRVEKTTAAGSVYYL